MNLPRMPIVAAVLATLMVTSASAQTRRPPRRPIPNLNGVWDSDEEGVVTVVQSGATIRVLSNRPCGGTQRSFYLRGTLSPPDAAGVMTINNGIMDRCESQHPLIQTCCGPRDNWQTTFKAEVIGDYSIVGTRVGEYWTAKTGAGGSINAGTCKKEYDFEDPIILLRLPPNAPPQPTNTPPANPGANPTPQPTPGSRIDDALDTIEEYWNDFTETVDDTVDDISDDSGFSESWEYFKNDLGVRKYILHTDHVHTDDGPEEGQ